MRLIVDANVILSAVLGTGGRIRRAVERGAELLAVDAQLVEAATVLRRFGRDAGDARRAVEAACVGIGLVALDDVADEQAAARARLGDRGQSDWPVLAASLAFDAAIWSDDRDFFGVGVAVWSTRNLDHIYLAMGTRHG